MNTTIFKKISETIKTQVPHPTLVGIGITTGVTAIIAALQDPSHLTHAMLFMGSHYAHPTHYGS